MWPMTVLIKEMTALKMFIHSKTRANIEVKEARNNNKGSALLPVEHWINRVEEFENAHNLVPTKEVKSAILTATMAPAASLDEFQHTEKQLHHYKVNHFAQKISCRHGAAIEPENGRNFGCFHSTSQAESKVQPR